MLNMKTLPNVPRAVGVQYADFVRVNVFVVRLPLQAVNIEGTVLFYGTADS
jgi:hypothetical protein